MLVRILKYWDDLNPLRQTPGGQGIWKGVQFVADDGGTADYVVIHGHLGKPVEVNTPPENIWLIMGEPPNELRAHWHHVPRWIKRVYMTDAHWAQKSAKHRLSPPGSPWHVKRDYDFLKSFEPPAKTRQLSWVTSDTRGSQGHRFRMDYLDKVRGMSELDLYGRGFQPIEDKWDGLVSYRYSIAFENYSNAHYWTEKLMDCYLAWTMPIYFGCKRLADYFPVGSFIQLDPSEREPMTFLRQVMASDQRERNLDALREARRRVLEDYNLFEIIVREVSKDPQRAGLSSRPSQRRVLRDHTVRWRDRVGWWARHLGSKMNPSP